MTVRFATEQDIPEINTLLYQVNNVHADGRSDIFIHGRKKYTSLKHLVKLPKEGRDTTVLTLKGNHSNNGNELKCTKM